MRRPFSEYKMFARFILTFSFLVLLAGCGLAATPTTLPSPTPVIIFPTLPLPSPTAPISGKNHIVFSQSVLLYGDGAAPSDWGSRIFVMDINNPRPIELTHGSGYDSYPTYSPDGQQIAYLSGGRYQPYDVMVVNADGSELRRVSERPNYWNGPILWSKDGRRVGMYLESALRHPWSILGLDGQTLEQQDMLLASDWYLPNRSPDGKRYAGPCSGDKLAVCFTPVHTKDQVDKHITNYFSWSSDGKHITFYRTGLIYTVDADGSNLNQLGEGYQPSWQP